LPEGVFLTVHEHTYPVRGRTVAAITRSMELAGPTWEGRAVQGLAEWRLRWEWRSTMHEGTCRLAGLRVVVEVEIILPSWKDHDSAASSLVLAWEDFETALRRHEYGHRDIGLQAATAVLRALGELRTPDCAAMSDVAGPRAREIARAYQKRNDLYERDTRRGQTQGAVWPPGG